VENRLDVDWHLDGDHRGVSELHELIACFFFNIRSTKSHFSHRHADYHKNEKDQDQPECLTDQVRCGCGYFAAEPYDIS
jgi:hypothetical protein